MPRQGGTSPKEIKTYVIGFGIGARRCAHREHRAAPAAPTRPGNLYGFYANDEAALSLAFSQIIADSQPPAEECNNEDDDCDGLVDEGIPKYCNKPAGITDPATCEGASDPTVCCDEPEETICDGEDDDCDGLIDEGVRNRCGQCGDEPAETCNGIDDDCDSKTDEMTEGGPCGTDEGRCEAGTERCVNGMLACRGEVSPRDETCNCMDDDCDGKIDEDIDGSLCEGSACVACECVPRCEPGEEFMPVCDAGRRADIQPNGECLCVIDNCDARGLREDDARARRRGRLRPGRPGGRSLPVPRRHVRVALRRRDLPRAGRSATRAAAGASRTTAAASAARTARSATRSRSSA